MLGCETLCICSFTSTVPRGGLIDAPEEGKSRNIRHEHSFTTIQYDLALFNVEGIYYAITDKCRNCGGSLSEGGTALIGRYAACSNEECRWNVKTGVCKFNHASVLPTYKVIKKEDGLYIDI